MEKVVEATRPHLWLKHRNDNFVPGEPNRSLYCASHYATGKSCQGLPVSNAWETSNFPGTVGLLV